MKISKFVFVTNFLDGCTARDLWKVCNDYGSVVDVYIPFKKSKAGKRFAFVRFIKVINLDRLIENLCTIWIGRYHLHANAARFNRPIKPSVSTPKEPFKGFLKDSFASVLKDGSQPPVKELATSEPVLVLDDSCIKEYDFSFSLMGKVKDVVAIPNLYSVLSNEGFHKFKLSYLGGMWILIELDYAKTKEKLLNHTGSLHYEERLWNWETQIPNPCREIYSSDDDELQENIFSEKEGDKENIDISDVERVSESSFSHANDSVYENSSNKNASAGNSHFEDPFNIYCLLNDQHKKASKSNTTEPEYPPGFTPVTDIGANPDATSLNGVNDQIHSLSNKLKERNSKDKVSSQNIMKGGSILDVMDELVKMNFLSLNVQSLGNKTKKGWIRELCQKHRIKFISIQETKMESIDLFSIKSLWGNLNFDHVVGPSVGFSGGIVCVWDSSIWDGETVVMGDFNEVRYEHERFGSIFNSHGAKAFNNFISLAGLIDIPLEAALCLDRHLSDHRPILLKESSSDFGPIPFRMFHSWFSMDGFSSFVVTTWKAMNIIEPNGLIRMKKKLQLLKFAIKVWSKEARSRTRKKKTIIHHKLLEVDKIIDQGMCNDDVISIRTNLLNEIQELNSLDAIEISQKAKIHWSIEDGVKHEFLSHFRKQFSPPDSPRFCFDYVFPNKLSSDQVEDLEHNVTYEEVKRAIWDCGTNKSPGPDGFTFKFFHEFWATIDQDVFQAVLEFFESGLIPRGCNASFIALIPKIQDAKLVKDFRPISLIGSIYKIITKILANRLCLVLPSIISEVQSAFVSNRNILDGPFLLNELLSLCKHKKRSALIFKVDSEKAADSVKWVYLLDTLQAFGFGQKWCNWINGCLQTATGSVLVNGSPSSEF
ncbi:RNA-directed DNA polymerase, eukaryota [Tanacetum coccineum]